VNGLTTVAPRANGDCTDGVTAPCPRFPAPGEALESRLAPWEARPILEDAEVKFVPRLVPPAGKPVLKCDVATGSEDVGDRYCNGNVDV